MVIHKTENNYSAYSPDVAGCGALGETIEETVLAMQQSLEMHIESMLEDNEELPVARGLRFYLEQNDPFAAPNAFITHLTVRIPEFA